ncbi:zona pellucida glycoprotein 2.3 precursor [Oncorhynchus mykiss]|uniref:Zona pellucida sperm-binding protein 4 n=1 Tax=Oncorhynchus mykiss TaxID=8022 RepID=Q9I9M7_ONCMY|nr:zona pellucida glycoprotein 2.3 precursor [Oncorhynchus mykiss]AAF71259.1 vitelline envelope protein beta [Oncorhynchus mykiss]
MKWSAVCLVAVATLGWLCDAQIYLEKPGWPPIQTPPSWPAQPPQKPIQPPQRPAQPPQWPVQPPQRPAQPPQRPAQPPQRPAQPQQWPAQPPQRPAQPPQWPAQPPQRPAQPPQRPAQPPQRPAQPPQRPAQPPQWPVHPPQWPVQPGTPLQRPKFPSDTGSKQSCDVDGQHKVQCGLPDITAAHCDAINCCFDGRMCFYGKSVTVQCTKDGQFVVVVARDATLPSLELDSISLLGTNGAHCHPIGTTSVFAIYQFKVTECGTVMTEETDTIIYENRMSSSYQVGVGPFGSITRDSQYDLTFQCRYKGSTIVAVVIDVKPVPPPNSDIAPGPLIVELRLGSGGCLTKGCNEEEVAYTSYYTEADYPVTKVLRDPVYTEVRILARTDPNIVLTLGRCWATTTPNPLSLPQWDLLIDGCPYQDDRYLTTPITVGPSSGLSYPTHYRRFVLKMFTFVDPMSMAPLRETVFIHCNTAVCLPSLGDSCEPRCYRKRRDIPAAVQKTARIKSNLVSSGELILTDPRELTN